MSRRAVFALIGVGVAGVAQALVLLVGWVRFDVSEDQALLWAAAESWGEFRPRQPHFWGQRYGVTFEAIPAEFLRIVGVGYPTGLPLGVFAMNVAAWGVLAAAAWWRARPVWAVAALAVPLVLPMEYVVLSIVFNTAFGRLLGCVCAALVILWPGRQWPFATALSLGGLSVLFDAASALIVLPALAVGLSELVAELRRQGGVRTALCAIGVGALTPIAWYAFAAYWYRVHPDDDLHPFPALSPEFGILRDNLSNPSRHFTTYSLEIARSPLVGLVVVASILGWALWRADHRARLSAGLVLVLLMVALAVPRSRAYLPTPYYPAGRVLMPLPMALWFVAFTTSAFATSTWRARTRRYGLVALTVLASVSAGVRVVTWSERSGDLRDAAESSPYELWRTSELVGLCDEVGRLARAHDVEYAMFEHRAAAYACASLLDSVTTFFPPYDRRRWTIHEVAAARPELMFIVGRTPIACSDVAELSCEGLTPDVGIVQLGSLGPLEAADLLGVAIRPFERS